MIKVQEQFELLGLKVEDRVTKYKGIVTSISFDLYGCVQVLVNPGLRKKEDKLGEQIWFDIGRLKVLDKTPVMNRPDFQFEKGPADKPSPIKA